MKKGALAATALAVGTGATAGTAAAQEDREVHVFGDDYRPGVDFNVVTELTTSAKEDVLDESGATDEVFDDPDDWNVYVINYDLGAEAPTWGILFAENAQISTGDSETMGEDGSFRDAQLDLVEVNLGAGPDEEEQPAEEEEEEPAQEEEEPAQEEENGEEADPEDETGIGEDEEE